MFNGCVLFWKDGVLGFIEYEKKTVVCSESDIDHAKFHIHKLKYSPRPHSFVFMKEFEQHLPLIQ